MSASAVDRSPARLPLRRLLPLLLLLLLPLGWPVREGHAADVTMPSAWPAAVHDGVDLISWSAPGAELHDPALATATLPSDGTLQYPVGGDHSYRRLTIACAHAGTLCLALSCPRALRIWINDREVLDEDLPWRDPQRSVQAVLLMPVAAGPLALTIQVGTRSRHPAGIDKDCPSRHRAEVLERLEAQLPDRLALAATLHEATLPACALRFSPIQYRQDGTAFQQVVLTPVAGSDPGPASDALLTLSTDLGVGVAGAGLVRAGMLGSGPAPAAHAGGTGKVPAPTRVAVFVPVVHGDLPPLRAAGDAEARAEPASQIALVRTLNVSGPMGRLAVPMPVFEGHGRLAPQREYRALAWPSASDLLAAVPEPILPERYAGFLRLYRKSWEMIHDLMRPATPTSGLPNGYIGTAQKGFMDLVFLWDSCFTAMGYRYAWRTMPATATLDLLYSFQQDGGYIPRESDARTGLPLLWEPDFSPNPPMLAVAELDLARLTGDVARLRRVYPALADHHRWLQANRRLPDGTYWTTGLANGLDNSPSLGDGYPDLTAQMAHAADCLAVIAAAIGKPDEAARWRADAATTGQACNAVLWSGQLKFYATSLAGGGHNPNKVVTGFWPLWAGIVPPERVQALVEQVQDPATFGRLHPVPSLAADSPAYKTAGNYWLGSTWAPTNTAVIKGFQRAGRMDVARALTIRHLQAMLTVFDATGRLWENYCPDQEVRGNQSTQDYSWTISGPTRLLIETLLGIESDALARRIRWTPIPGETCGIRRLAFADATVTVLQTVDAAGTATITVTTDQPFTLELVDGAGRSQDHAIAPGSVTFPR